ncbi:hypothetical protein K502DRAFT_345680 [Neoconidiobolus thromboides FSU 785]|nr:hypothetical protein K502DRAFT_345680 [Neoconidiobolus thromboides FSU 785]
MNNEKKYKKDGILKKFNIANLFNKLKPAKKESKFEKLPSIPPSPQPNKEKNKRISLPIIPSIIKSLDFTNSSRRSFQSKRNSLKHNRPQSSLNLISASQQQQTKRKSFFKCRNIQVEGNSDRDLKIRSLSLENERNDGEIIARKQLRSIRSFDEMIFNGFDPIFPNQPRPLTVSFSITPKLQSESLLT